MSELLSGSVSRAALVLKRGEVSRRASVSKPVQVRRAVGLRVARALGLGVCVSLAASVGGAQAPVFQPPGACVAVPTPSYHVHRHIRQSSPPDRAYPLSVDDVVGYGTSRAVDIDGDGVMDFLVPEPAPGDCNQDMHVALYLARGGCGHRLGVVHGALDIAAARTAPRSHGLPELTTSVPETVQDDPRQPALRRTHVRTYRFDGRLYVEVAHTQSDSVCHHCSLARCRTEPGPVGP